MEQLQVIEKLFESFTDTLDVDHPKYMYSGAIYDVWRMFFEYSMNNFIRYSKPSVTSII